MWSGPVAGLCYKAYIVIFGHSLTFKMCDGKCIEISLGSTLTHPFSSFILLVQFHGVQFTNNTSQANKSGSMLLLFYLGLAWNTRNFLNEFLCFRE